MNVKNMTDDARLREEIDVLKSDLIGLKNDVKGAAALALTGGASGLVAVIVLLVFAGLCRRKT